jgi:hypothetical protein
MTLDELKPSSWIAIVGNGPSAANPRHAMIVERCDYVVRMSQFRRHFPKEEAGSKLSAWAHYGAPKMMARAGVIPRSIYDLWFTQPPSREEGATPGAPSMKAAVEQMDPGGGSVYQIGESHFAELRAAFDKWRENAPHDMTVEKLLMAELHDKKVWLGHKIRTAIVWLGRPCHV